MYKKQIPFKDYNGKPRNATVTLNLDERDVFKLLTEFKTVFDWQESLKGPEREMPTEEVVEFYTAFEDILLAAYGVVTNDGLEFDRSGVYAFKQSAMFSAMMVMFLQEPAETNKMIKDIIPSGLEDMVRKASANFEALEGDPDSPEAMRAELARLRAANITAGLPAPEEASAS